MGNIIGMAIEGIAQGGLVAQVQAAAMTGNSVALVLAPVVLPVAAAVATISSVVTLALTGQLQMLTHTDHGRRE